jgi:hypothetical protein
METKQRLMDIAYNDFISKKKNINLSKEHYFLAGYISGYHKLESKEKRESLIKKYNLPRKEDKFEKAKEINLL